MVDNNVSQLLRAVEEQTKRVLALRRSVFSVTDPAENESAFTAFTEAEAKLDRLQQECQAAQEASKLSTTEDVKPATRPGRFLGEKTTGLRVESKILMDPLPTGAYHLMDPETEPLVSVSVENVSRDIRRVCVKAHIEGLSAHAVRTTEIEPRKTATFNLQPTLFLDRVRGITEVQRSTLHVIVEDLDGKLECHNTHVITCLARTASFNAVRRPDTGESLDLSHYYGAWVTPHAECVQERIRRSVEIAADQQMLGYQGDPDQVAQQVAALYRSLHESGIVYVNSVIDYGASAGMTTQRTRLPRESMAVRSANCIDGTVLLASLIEGVSLNPAIVLLPGHAFVGWETWFGSDEWRFLETTMIGTSEFEAATASAERQYAQFSKYNREKIKLHSISNLRSRGIWPME